MSDHWLKWIQENWIWICPVLVALYGVARAIVAATPTPKDDEALKEVNKLVRVLAGIFGLNLKQGITKKLPLLIVVAGLTLSPGCATIEALSKDPAAQYKVSKMAYVETVDILIRLQKAGKLDKDEKAAAIRVVEMGREVLDGWAEALEQGKDYPDGATLMAPVMTQLKDFIIAGERKQ